MSWYRNEIHDMVNLTLIGNKYLNKGQDDQKSRYYGSKFSEKDLEPR